MALWFGCAPRLCCRDPLPPSGLPTALLSTRMQQQGCHLEAKHTRSVTPWKLNLVKIYNALIFVYFITVMLVEFGLLAPHTSLDWCEIDAGHAPTFIRVIWSDGLIQLFPAVLCGTPPAVENAHLIGRRRSHYDIHAVVRYQCSEGFFQRHIPTARCRADGSWERPRIICTKCECSTSSLNLLHVTCHACKN